MKNKNILHTDIFSIIILFSNVNAIQIIWGESKVINNTPGRGNKNIRVGVVGVGRGEAFIKESDETTGLKLVAICDIWEEKLKAVGEKYNIATYSDYDKFLEHDMDAVVLANYFHDHASFAIKALVAGKHVMSETSCNATIAEGVALCRAVEKTGLIYMLAENYPYTAFNQEMRRLYINGEVGKVLYAEGEYNHPSTARDRLMRSPGRNHWRSWTPPTYYCTHALAPLMYITETMPKTVNSLSIASQEVNEMTVRMGDPGSVILCRMDNGAVFRIFGLSLPGHSVWYRVHGTKGAMENTRGPGYWGPGQVRVWHEEWNLKQGESRERTYTPNWPEYGELAEKAGHGGGDFWTCHHFANAVRTGVQPFLDVYRGVAMSSVGILAWKSALEDGKPFEVPDFKDESSRVKYENDNWSPFPAHAGPGQPPPSILGIASPSGEAIAFAHEVWKEIGYDKD